MNKKEWSISKEIFAITLPLSPHSDCVDIYISFQWLLGQIFTDLVP